MNIVNYPVNSFTKGRPYGIKNIIVHHMAGVLTAKTCANVLNSRRVSAHYAIGSDGVVARMVDEGNRAWHAGDGVGKGSKGNDKGIGIEVANSATGGNWPVDQKRKDLLVELCYDIAKRNGMLPLKRGVNLFGHRDCQATTCLPLDTELLTKNGWVKLSDISIGDEVAAPHLDDLSISFSPVEGIVPVKTQDTWTMRGVTATADHRMVYGVQSNKMANRIDEFLRLPEGAYIPSAGQYNGKGLDISDDELRLIIAIQADGHYMYDDRKVIDGVRKHTGDKSYYGIEFHLKKARKIDAISDLLDALGYDFTVSEKSDGSVSMRVFGQDILAFANKWLDDKNYKWDMLELDKRQAKLFLDTLLDYDGCRAGNDYSSSRQVNLDIVAAVASLNGVGVRGTDRVYFRPQFRSIARGTEKRRNRQQQVSCVTVATGLILIRQNGRTTIVGNCPGNDLYGWLDELVRRVNAKDTPAPSPAPKPTPKPAPAPAKDPFLPARGWWRLGDTDARIGRLATFMRKTFPSYTPKAALGNYYGPNLQKAVKEFQRRAKAAGRYDDVADGMCGPKTLAALRSYGFKN